MATGEKQGAHYCASCKFGGGLVDLVMHVRDVAYGGAADWLADVRAGGGERAIVLSARVEVRAERRGFRVPREVVFAPLTDWPAPARDFATRRGIEGWQVERWGIGYAVDGRLGGRIVIVFRNSRGESAGYSARTFGKDLKRYLAPREEEGADYGVMFGEERWPAIAQRRIVVALEGALNALAVERVLVQHGVAASVGAFAGSRASSTVFAKLATFRRVVRFTDSDHAGDDVAEELFHGLARHVEVPRVRLGAGQDPNNVDGETLWRAMWGAFEADCTT